MILTKVFYYSFVMSFVGMMTMTLIKMFFSHDGMVIVYEHNIFIRVSEIVIGFILMILTVWYIKKDVIEEAVKGRGVK